MADSPKAVIPLKVYRGHAHGSGVPQRPDTEFPGYFNDTTALQAWVAALAKS